MDTVGLDEGDAEDVNGELVQKIMNFLLHSLKVQVLGAQIPVDIAKVWSWMAPRNNLVHYSRGQGTNFTIASRLRPWLCSFTCYPQKLQYLREQAAVIKLFEERFTSIWENVIILAKEGKEDTKQSFQVQEK